MAPFYCPQVLPNGVFRLKSLFSLNSELCIELQSDRSVKLAPLDESSVGQKWDVVADVENALYTFRNGLDSSFLGVEEFPPNVLLCHGSNTATTWTIEPRGQAFIIGEPETWCVLDISNDGNIVSLLARNNQMGQRWVFDCVDRILPDSENLGPSLPTPLYAQPTVQLTSSKLVNNLLDANGNPIWSTSTYKLMFADGTELGQGSYGRESFASPDSPCAGAIIQYVRVRGKTVKYGWPEGDIGYLKGYIVNFDGKGNTSHLSLSGSSPGILQWYSTDNSYGFTAKQLPGFRLALYAKDKKGSSRGVRLVKRSGSNPGYFIEDSSTHNLTIECSMVEIANPLTPL